MLGIVAWEGLTRGLGVEEFLLPPLSDILQTLREQWSLVWSAGLFTFKEALGGFVIGCRCGDPRGDRAGPLAPRRPRVHALSDRRERDPDHRLRADHEQLVRAPQPASKMAIAAVLVFFPVLVNSIRGLTSVRPGRSS